MASILAEGRTRIQGEIIEFSYRASGLLRGWWSNQTFLPDSSNLLGASWIQVVHKLEGLSGRTTNLLCEALISDLGSKVFLLQQTETFKLRGF